MVTPRPTGIRAATKYIPEVESLRGVAIFLVFFHHADGMLTPGLVAGDLSVSPLRAFIAGGQTGVSLFFVLSAFCLSLPFFSRPQNVEGFSLRRFYERRALRILPLYWTMLLVGTAHSARSADLARILPYAFFLSTFPALVDPIQPYSNVWWSLGTEVQFYVLLPLLPFAMRSPLGRWLASVFLALYSSWFALFIAGAFPAGSTINEIALAASVLGRGPMFLTGIAVAWIYERHGSSMTKSMTSNRFFRRGGGDILLLLTLACLGCLLRWQVDVGFFHAESRSYFAWHIAEGMLWGSVLVVLLTSPLHTKVAYCNRLFSRMGLWSYSIYLLHLPVLVFGFAALRGRYPGQFVRWEPATALVVFALAAVCLAISACTYRWIERPFLERKAKLA